MSSLNLNVTHDVSDHQQELLDQVMFENGDPIFSKFELFGFTLRNRLVVAPMTRVSATDDGLATDEMASYYHDFARGGFGIVITEGTYTDEDASQGYERQPGMANERQAESWTAVTSAIRGAGYCISRPRLDDVPAA